MGKVIPPLHCNRFVVPVLLGACHIHFAATSSKKQGQILIISDLFSNQRKEKVFHMSHPTMMWPMDGPHILLPAGWHSHLASGTLSPHPHRRPRLPGVSVWGKAVLHAEQL